MKTGGCILLLMSLTCLPATAQEEDLLEDEFELLREEEIVYTAAKHKQDISESPSAISVITREDIVNTHCTDLICLLRQVPEVQVRRVTSMYHAAGARSLTGEIGDRILVLVDGREVNEELVGIVYWTGLPIHLEDIQRIEIIRGPGSSLYGANALSMVVSITTRKSDSDRAEVFAGGGEHDRVSAHASVDRVLGDWNLHLSGGRETADAWCRRDTRERELHRFRFRIQRQGREWTTTLQAGVVSGGGSFYTNIAPGYMHDILIPHAILTHTGEWLRAQVWFNFLKADLELDLPLYYRGMLLGAFLDSIPFHTTTTDGEVQVNWSPFEGNLLVGGASYRLLTFFSEYNDPQDAVQHRVAVFLQDEQRLWDRLILTAGARLDVNSKTPLAFSPRFAAVYKFVKGHLIRAAFGRAFRKPSFFYTSTHLLGAEGTSAFPELGEFFRKNIGNENLGNESVTAFELGYRGRFLGGDLTAEAGVFYNLYRDSFNFPFHIETNNMGVPDLSRSSIRFENKGRDIDSLGGSISLVYRIRSRLRLSANYSYRYNVYVTEPPGGAVPGQGGKGDRVPWEPPHLANLGFHYLAAKGLRLGATLHYHSDSTNKMPEHGGLFDDQIGVHCPGALVVGAFVSWAFELESLRLEAGVRAYNLLNAGFRDTTSIIRSDGVELGGELIGRRIFAFLRGAI